MTERRDPIPADQAVAPEERAAGERAREHHAGPVAPAVPGGHEPAPVDRDRDLDRFLTFIDAIVAIAVTLLILPLAEIADEFPERSLTELLAAHTGEVFNFLLSFLVITQLWFAQHRIVRTVVVPDPVVIRYLVAWALTVVVLPVPTALVAASSEGDMTEPLYIATMVLSSLCLTLTALRVAARPAIGDGRAPTDPLSSITATATMVLALLISLVFPLAGYLPLLLLLLSGRVARLIRSRLAAR
ncbi:TMEM175 family protein [Auraticoccus monumenti]|uniref:Uncharacterized membrane protein n=1 Tax=Auraticoccus monumenti TaxID=675864 RepID=A0A1G6VIH9_9ACTN|nr:TMEM175 family protein [Auraticoccus monumenti]SDD53369.1 Uncharacterized membrane protein [Auraticoccus monumenti]